MGEERGEEAGRESAVPGARLLHLYCTQHSAELVSGAPNLNTEHGMITHATDQTTHDHTFRISLDEKRELASPVRTQ